MGAQYRLVVRARIKLLARTRAKMNDLDLQAWLTHVLARIAQHPASRLYELLPWNWRPLEPAVHQAARPSPRSPPHS